MPAHAFATADTLLVSDRLVSDRSVSDGSGSESSTPARPRYSDRSLGRLSDPLELVAAAVLFRERLRSRHGALFAPADIVRDISKRAKHLGREGKSQGQHLYQMAAHSTCHATSPLSLTATALRAGFYRLELEVPARVRLLRWQAKCALKRIEDAAVPVFGFSRSRKVARKVLPLLLLLGASVACSLVSKDGAGGGKGFAMGPPPSLSKKKSAAPRAEKNVRNAPWSYVLPVDYGVRVDESGHGHFRAPRFHGEHNGLDLLAPVGTPTFSPCDGQATTGISRSFGRWVHIICPVPGEYVKKGGPTPWASFFYAHLDKADLVDGKWTDVSGGQALGTVGKSGNARGPNVQPHLHLELIVQKNQRAAMDERHLGSDQSSVPAADYFADSLSSDCMEPRGFEPKSQLLRRARRIDPFVALTCLSQAKPNFVQAPSPLTESSLAWTRLYVAKDFNVNLGLEDARVARR